MVMVSVIAESNDEASIGDRPHLREKPFPADKSDGPLSLPARLRNR
jgi:hypothetical protein